MTTAVHWNDQMLMKAAGQDPETVFNLLDRHGQTEPSADGFAMPTVDAIYQWTSRKKIPDRWRARIVYVLLAERKIEMGNLFRVGNEAKRQKNYRAKAAT